MTPSRRSNLGEGHAAPRSVFQYVDILRDRWLSASVAFLIVAGLVAVDALFSTPAYESQAMIQLDMQGAGSDQLAEVTLAGSQANIDAELQVMLSHSVAARAAVTAGAGVVIQEEDGYRPWNSLLRSYASGGEPTRLAARLATLPLPNAQAHLRLVFDEKGKRFRLEDVGSGHSLGEFDFDRVAGGVIQSCGVTLLLSAPEGLPAGQAYSLDLELGKRPAATLEPVAKGSPVRLSVQTAVRTMPQQGGTYRITFDDKAEQFEVHPLGQGDRLGPIAWSAEEGAEIAVSGETIRLGPVEGSPAGRRFILRLRTSEAAAIWVRSTATAAQVGAYTGMVNIGAATEDPYLARRLAVALSASYIEQRKERKEDRIVSRLQWLKDEIVQEEDDLTAALDARDDYITKHGAILLSQKATAAFEAQSKLFEQRLEQKQILMQARSTLEALRLTKAPDKVMAAIGTANVDAQTQAIADSLVQLEVQRGALLRGRSTQDDLKVKGFDAEIAELKSMLDKRIAALREEVEAQILRRIEAVNGRLGQIQAEDKRHADVLEYLPKEERNLAELNRKVEAAHKRYVFLERMQGESELARTSTLAQAHLIDAALLNTGRKSPVLFRRALVAIFLGLFAAVGMALLRHIRDRTIQSPGEIEDRLGLQLFAAIPTFSSVPRRQRRGLDSSLVVRDVPTSTLSENYRTLRANIRFADTGKPIQAFTMTSALPSEGKTVTTLNLAIAMARAGNSVLVVDADLRRPMVDTHLEGQREPGVAEVLLGEISWREARQDSGVEGMSFIAAGRKLSDPSSLLEGGRFEQFLKELREEFEYILFDVPPVLAVADAAAFFRSLDAVLLVVRQGACPADIVAGAQEQVERFGGKLVGAVFNGFNASRAGTRRYGYGSYYGCYGYYAGYVDHAAHGGEGGSREKPRSPIPPSDQAEAGREG